jgi:hypothetical protein
MFNVSFKIAGQNCHIKLSNKSFENVTKFKNSRTMVTDQNHIHEGIERKIYIGGWGLGTMQFRIFCPNVKICETNFPCCFVMV